MSAHETTDADVDSIVRMVREMRAEQERALRQIGDLQEQMRRFTVEQRIKTEALEAEVRQSIVRLESEAATATRDMIRHIKNVQAAVVAIQQLS
jgi:protein-arginine kinase activator protein McsA